MDAKHAQYRINTLKEYIKTFPTFKKEKYSNYTDTWAYNWWKSMSIDSANERIRELEKYV